MVYTVSNTTYPASIEYYGDTYYYIPYEYGSVIGPEKWWVQNDQEETYSFINNHWKDTIWIAIFYCLGIHALQRYMAKREAWELKWPLIVWNGTLALFSFIGTLRVGEEFMYVIRSRPLLDSISYVPEPFQVAGFWAFCFAVSKIFELVDTVFVVLRKKPLIFLHWYHHAIVLVYVWHAAKDGVAGSRWFVFMNFAVHSLMYTYYALAAGGIRLPRSISMTITSLQTTQMFIGVAISFIVYYYKLQGRVMQHSYENLYFCFAIYVSFAFLFSNFFNKSYLNEKEKKTKVQ